MTPLIVGSASISSKLPTGRTPISVSNADLFSSDLLYPLTISILVDCLDALVNTFAQRPKPTMPTRTCFCSAAI